MNYSTLQEAYNIDTFEKKSKPSNKSRNPNGGLAGGLAGGSNGANANTSPAFVETSKLALSSCSPLQAPTYNIPISNDCKREHEETMNVYTNANNNMGNNMNAIPTSINNTQHFSNGTGPINASNTGNPNIISNPNNANNLQLSQSQQSQQAPLLPAQNLFNNSNDNVMPYYDEDLEQYFNISNLNDEVKYNPNNPNNNANNANNTKYPYMPNNNKQSYTNNDTAEYTNNNTLIKNGNNLLNNSSYNLTPEEKKSAEEAMAYLKSIEEKINGGSGYNRNTIADPVAPTVNTGPAGFKTPEKPVPPPLPVAPVVPLAKNESNYIYNAIFNISILLIIGIAIILLCDQIVELSIQIGMKRVVNILEPFIKTPVQELVNN